jgi:hypothetical protein
MRFSSGLILGLLVFEEYYLLGYNAVVLISLTLALFITKAVRTTSPICLFIYMCIHIFISSPYTPVLGRYMYDENGEYVDLYNFIKSTFQNLFP